MVVNFAVVNYDERAGFVGHRLTAARKIDDAQAPMRKVGVLIVIENEIVRSAMSKVLSHATEVHDAAGIRRRGDKPGRPAHPGL